MRSTYRVRSYRTFTPKPPSAQLINAIKNSRFIEKSENAGSDFVAKNKFADFDICQQLKTNIQHKEYDSPTPIQDESIPPILEGKDIIGIANTGTGKTAAFLIPLINKVFKNPSEKVFILAPTRELAVQINDELKDFTAGMRISSALCIGGANMHRQKMNLRRNPNFVIGTPGRVRDLIEHRSINLSQFRNVVLDETDRMVDIGFINDIKYFISLLPEDRQSLFFSATVSGKVREIIASFVKNPITVTVKQRETAENIQQDIIKTANRGKKVDQLHDLLIKDGFAKVLIFGRTKWGVQKLADELVDRGFKAGAIHGNKGQNQRQRTLDEFKKNVINILLATDVASRGLDIPDVSHVINYDMPATYDDYVHRIGRTGRANKKGIALTFVD
ncbi:DEAD/DEAH box helicase [Patescibacteria group bacterium]|nr:DEAD/DEAH box helicase [Patescibacteria group bacterium]